MFTPIGRSALRAAIVVPFVVLACVVAHSVDAQEFSAAPSPDAVERSIDGLLAEYPAVRRSENGFGKTIFHGAAMSRAETPELAVETWIALHAAALGARASDFEFQWSAPLSDGRAHAFAYRMTSGDIPVEGGVARFVVRPDPITGTSRVVHAAAHTALAPDDGYPDVLVTAATAASTALATLPDPVLHRHAPQLVIEPSATRLAPSRLVWHVAAHAGPAEGLQSWTVVIDPVDGRVLQVRDELLDIDVDGEVRAWISGNNAPDIPSNPPVEQALAGATVRILGGASVYSAPDGTFTIPHGGSGAVTVETILVGEYVQVFDVGGSNALVSVVVTPPGPITLEVNPLADPLLQAQVNGFHYTNVTHDFVRDRTAGIPTIDVAIPCNVNINDDCNAYFDPSVDTINFFTEGNGCPNTAFASVVSHEYGHFVVNELGVSQGAFGEGFGDVMSMFIYDDPIIGTDFFGPGTSVRDPIAANIQYPCNQTGVHYCGQILSASWWRIRENFGSAFGPSVGLEEARQLFVDWSLITLGGQGSSSAHPDLAIEVLTIDDDDGEIENGTPRFDLICDAFALASIDCPVLPELLISFPFGRPDTFVPGVPTEIIVDIEPGTGTLLTTSPAVMVRNVGSGTFLPIFLTSAGGDRYTGEIPAQDCGGIVAFYVGAQDTVGNFVTLPSGGESDPYEEPVYSVIADAFADEMETDTGWQVGAPSDTATTGVWERVEPVGTQAAPSSDNSDPGTFCWVTGQGIPGAQQGANDVDGGATTLTTPLLDLSVPGEYVIRYSRWYANDTGSAPNDDVLTVDVSNDDGANWTPVEVVGPGGPEASGGWFTHEFDVASLLPPTAAMRLRFIASDEGGGSIVEAAIDDLVVQRRECDPVEQFSRGEVNGDGSLNLSDAVSVLIALFGGGTIGCPDAADSNDDGSLNLADVITLLGYLFAGDADLPPPFGSCGVDPTDDALDCASSPSCP